MLFVAHNRSEFLKAAQYPLAQPRAGTSRPVALRSGMDRRSLRVNPCVAVHRLGASCERCSMATHVPSVSLKRVKWRLTSGALALPLPKKAFQGAREMTPLGAGHPIAKRFAGRVTDAKSQAAAGRRTEDRTMDGAA